MMFTYRETRGGWQVELALPENGDDPVICHAASIRWRSGTVIKKREELFHTYEAARAIVDRRNGITRRP